MRLAVYCKMQIIEIPEEKPSDHMDPCDRERKRRIEGERILSHLTPEQYVMALSMNGRMWTPQRLSMKLDDLTAGGQKSPRICHWRDVGLSGKGAG